MQTVPYKIIWIASMPRSGSTWAFNVARSLLREAGLTVLPPTIPKNDPEMVAAAQQGLRDRTPANVWCLKVHSILRNASPTNRFVSTVRDPRDVVVSFMRFIRCDFERALVAATIWTRVCDYYRALPPEHSLCLDYDAIVADPIGVALRITAFLGLDLPEQDIAAAVAEFERGNVRRRLAALQMEVARQGSPGKDESSVVVNDDGSLRAWDPQTGFQTDHVSDYRPGDWRAMLTGEQKRRLDETIGAWLTQQGYDRRLEP